MKIIAALILVSALIFYSVNHSISQSGIKNPGFSLNYRVFPAVFHAGDYFKGPIFLSGDYNGVIDEDFRIGLQDLGFDVVVYELPELDLAHFSVDGGAAYRNKWGASVVDLVRGYFKGRPGYRKKQVIFGGAGWGGLHAIMAAEVGHGIVAGWFAYKPVINLDHEVRLAGANGIYFNPVVTYEFLKDKPGCIVVGRDFKFTDWQELRAKIGNINEVPDLAGLLECIGGSR